MSSGVSGAVGASYAATTEAMSGAIGFSISSWSAHAIGIDNRRTLANHLDQSTSLNLATAVLLAIRAEKASNELFTIRAEPAILELSMNFVCPECGRSFEQAGACSADGAALV